MYHRVPSGSSPDQFAPKLLIGQQFIPLSCSMSDQEIARATPPHLRPSGISRLFLDGEFSGAALILPHATTTAARPVVPAEPFRIPPRAGAKRDELLMIGQSPDFTTAIDIARRTAAAGSMVLIQGETGVGKELFARLIHSSAPTRDARPLSLSTAGRSRLSCSGPSCSATPPGIYRRRARRQARQVRTG